MTNAKDMWPREMIEEVLATTKEKDVRRASRGLMKDGGFWGLNKATHWVASTQPIHLPHRWIFAWLVKERFGYRLRSKNFTSNDVGKCRRKLNSLGFNAVSLDR